MRERILSILVTVLWISVGIGIFNLIPGCAWCQRVTNAVFNVEPEKPVIPETPKAQLWETIRGLTPNWLAIPVIALGAVAMFNGAMKLGMSCVIFGSVNLFMALATSRFGFWMAVCGLIGSVAAVASTMLMKNKALKEIVFGIQLSKGEFGQQWSERKKAINECQKEKQTKLTKKIVRKIKTKAKLRGEM